MKNFFVSVLAMMFGAFSFAQFTTTLPGHLEAEDYNAMRGVQKGTLTGGTLVVNSIDKDDWMLWRVTSTLDGSYVALFRVNTSATGAEIQLKDSATSQILKVVKVPNTRGQWTTITDTVKLAKGVGAVIIYSSGLTRWSLNWFELNFIRELYFRNQVAIPNRDSVLVQYIWTDGTYERRTVHTKDTSLRW